MHSLSPGSIVKEPLRCEGGQLVHRSRGTPANPAAAARMVLEECQGVMEESGVVPHP